MPLWGAHPAQSWWYGQTSSPAFSLTERQYKVLRMFPRFMHESKLIQDFSKAIANEATSRAGDLVSELLRNQRPSLVRSQFIDLLETQYGLPIDTSLSIDVRRANVFYKTLRRHRTRLVDIATVVRQFLNGTTTYAIVQVESTKNIRVRDISDFVVGETIYIGAELRTIQSIDHETQTLVVDSEVSADAYTLVSNIEVEIIDFPSSYYFVIFLDENSYDDLTPIINAVNEIKPAHLGFVIAGAPGITYNEVGIQYNEAGIQYTGVLYDGT